MEPAAAHVASHVDPGVVRQSIRLHYIERSDPLRNDISVALAHAPRGLADHQASLNPQAAQDPDAKSGIQDAISGEVKAIGRRQLLQGLRPPVKVDTLNRLYDA